MPSGLAVLIGLNSVDPNHYGGWSGDLVACEADAIDMAQIATSQGFTTTQLLTSKATRARVRQEILTAAGRLKAGDIFLITYSGHGGQLPDLNSDESDDLQDETWCLFDGEMVDDELAELWTKFAAGVRVFVLSDSCHSGTVTKLAYYGGTRALGLATLPTGVLNDGQSGPRYRFMPPEVALRTYRQNSATYDPILKASRSNQGIAATVRLISGCQDNQLSADGTFNGLFTGTLLRVWNNGGFKGTYSEFHKAILRRMPPDQSPQHFVIGASNAAFDGETPFSV